MILFNLAFKNIRRNFYSYFMYFLSMVFSILIYYTFVSIKYSQYALELAGLSTKIDASMGGASIVMIIFSAIFIWYSNSFFTKKRKKEFGLYSMMGVKRRQIGRMFFYENVLMGVLAVIGGIFFGVLLSKLFTMMLMKLMGYNIAVSFVISKEAIFDTLKVFSVLFFVAALQGYYIIYRYKLIDLFKAESKAEKEPKANPFLAVLSVIMVATSYVTAHTLFFMSPIIGMLVTLFLAISGTYVFFSVFMVFLMKISKKNKKRYYKSTKMIATTNLLFRIKNNSRTLATIAVLSATALTAIGFSYSYYYNILPQAKLTNPFSVSYKYQGEEFNRQVKEIIEKNGQKTVFDKKISIINIDADIPAIKNLPSEIYGDGQKRVSVISQSQFNQIAEKIFPGEQVYLDGYTNVIVCDNSYSTVFTEKYEKEILELTNGDEKKELKIYAIKTIQPISTFFSYLPVIVSDDLYRELRHFGDEQNIQCYELNKPLEAGNIIDDIRKILPENVYLGQYYNYYVSLKEAFGVMIFISAFLGIVFLIATGTIIYFKQLTEANEDWRRYVILKNIGVSKKQLKKIISGQMKTIFAVPLIVGLTHASFALAILVRVLGVTLIKPIIMTFTAYTLIYVLFYFLTVSSYNKIVLSHRN